MNVFEQKIITDKLRTCQKEAYQAILTHFSNPNPERNVLIQLPTGTGKTALIAITPFNIVKKRVLVLCPGVKLAKQIESDLDIVNNESQNTYRKLDLLGDETLNNLELYTLRLEDSVSESDIKEHQILVANYHQLQDLEKWFKDKQDEVDLIIIDEAHHQEANTYKEIIKFFKNAKVIGLTATPFRSDGKKIEGNIIYKYHFHQAIKDKIIRNIKITNVTPKEVELSFIDNGAKKYSLKEILELKEDSWFNREIALSPDCCDSIAQKAKEKLDELNKQFPKSKHQIIASAMTKRHAREYIKPAFEKLGLKVGMVSSDIQDKPHNDKVFEELKYGKISVIVHIGMLGEGFDHPPLGVAAIFRPYKSLNPYIQFLGRVIRRNDDTTFCHVVSHIGLNQIKRFEEFKLFDYEDKKFLEELFSEKESQSFVDDEQVKEMEKDSDNQGVEEKNTLLKELGDDVINFESQFVKEEDINQLVDKIENLNPEMQKKLFEKLGIDMSDVKMFIGKKRTRIKPVDKRKASRGLLNEKEKSIATDILKSLHLKHKGRNFNKMFENFAWVKRKVSREVNKKLELENEQRVKIDNATFTEIEQKGLLDDIQKECLEYFKEKVK